MSYLSAIRSGNEVIVWERQDGKRVPVSYPAPFYFYVEDPNGEHTTIYGDKVTRYDFDEWKDFTTVKKKCVDEKMKLFESDIPPDLKVLSKEYYGADAPTLNITFLDIEVDYDERLGFSSPTIPYAEINSVAFYH